MTDIIAVQGPSAIPPTPTHYPYIGITPNVNSLAENGFATVADAINYYDNYTGGLTVYRTFSSGGIGTWASGQVGNVTSSGTGATVCHSFKSWSTTDVTNWMDNKPDNGLDAFLTYFHEPENDGWNAFQILDWKQKLSQMIDIRDGLGRTDIKIGPILMGSWTLNPLSGRNYWRDWYVGPRIPGYTPASYPTGLNEMDFLGWDPYDESSSYVAPTSILDGTHSIMDIMRVTGRPYVIGEFGTVRNRVNDPGDGSAVAAFLRDYYQATLDFYTNEGIRCLAAMWWSDRNTGSSNNFSLKAEPLALDEVIPFATASRAHYGIVGG